jgi:hypothetical protein
MNSCISAYFQNFLLLTIKRITVDQFNKNAINFIFGFIAALKIIII